MTVINPALPRLVKQQFATKIQNRTPSSIKDEVSHFLQLLVDEIESAPTETRAIQPINRRGGRSFPMRGEPVDMTAVDMEAGKPE